MPSKTERVGLFFADRMRAIEIVNEVKFTEDEEGVTAWVITKGPAFDFESNKPIYEAALDAMGLQGEPTFDFRVINVNELAHGATIDDLLPKRAKLGWKRGSA